MNAENRIIVSSITLCLIWLFTFYYPQIDQLQHQAIMAGTSLSSLRGFIDDDLSAVVHESIPSFLYSDDSNDTLDDDIETGADDSIPGEADTFRSEEGQNEIMRRQNFTDDDIEDHKSGSNTQKYLSADDYTVRRDNGGDDFVDLNDDDDTPSK
jgi:hypothetical protein